MKQRPRIYYTETDKVLIFQDGKALDPDFPTYTQVPVYIVISTTQVDPPYEDPLLCASLHFGRDR
jgi:hypothetical protein